MQLTSWQQSLHVYKYLWDITGRRGKIGDKLEQLALPANSFEDLCGAPHLSGPRFTHLETKAIRLDAF